MKWKAIILLSVPDPDLEIGGEGAAPLSDFLLLSWLIELASSIKMQENS